jgi:transposase
MVVPFAKKSQDWMRTLDIPGVDVQLNMISAVQGQIELVNEMIRKEFDRREEVRNLTSIPGIGIYSALVIYAEIGDVRRFPDPEHLCSYAGLTPTVSQSASSVHYGGISKEGSKQLRWILTEAVHTHHRYEPGSNLSRFYDKIAKKRGKQKAAMAAARKLLHIIYWMMLNGEPYHGHGFNPVAKPAA